MDGECRYDACDCNNADDGVPGDKRFGLETPGDCKKENVVPTAEGSSLCNVDCRCGFEEDVVPKSEYVVSYIEFV